MALDIRKKTTCIHYSCNILFHHFFNFRNLLAISGISRKIQQKSEKIKESRNQYILCSSNPAHIIFQIPESDIPAFLVQLPVCQYFLGSHGIGKTFSIQVRYYTFLDKTNFRIAFNYKYNSSHIRLV